jgi:hypothetical protein
MCRRQRLSRPIGDVIFSEQSSHVNDPALIEKDYWIMHALYGLKKRRGQ